MEVGKLWDGRYMFSERNSMQYEDGSPEEIQTCFYK